jgi:hypothetical protein
MSLQTGPFSPLTYRVPLVLTWLRRETAIGRPVTVAFAHLCTALRIPQDQCTPLLRLLVDEGYVTEADGQVCLVNVEAKRLPPAVRAWSTEITPLQRSDRSERSPMATVLLRLYRERRIGGNATSSFPMLCDVTSIPRDLRANLLDQLVSAQYVTREGDQIRITEAGQQQAAAPLMQPPPADTTPNLSPFDSASRVRTPGSGPRSRR